LKLEIITGPGFLKLNFIGKAGYLYSMGIIKSCACISYQKIFFVALFFVFMILMPLSTKAGETDLVAKRTAAIKIAENLLSAELPALNEQMRNKFDSLDKELIKLKNDKTKHDAALNELINQGAVILSAGGVKAGPLLCLGSKLLLEYPDSWRAANYLGATLQAARRHKESKTVLEYALALSPKEPYAYINLGYVLLDLEQDELAKKMAHAVLASTPINRDAWQLLGAYYWKKQDTKA